MSCKIFSHLQRVLRMPLHSQVEGFDALQEQERVEWSQTPSGVTQPLDAGFDDEGQRPESGRIGNAVIRRVGLNEVLKSSRCSPIELAAVSNDSAYRCPMAADVFRRRVDDDVCAPLNRAA